MNRQKKEELKKFHNDTKGMSPVEIDVYLQNNALKKERDALIDLLHNAIFPEEYDYRYDTHLQSSRRKSGINPLSEWYVKTINERRRQLGVEAYICTQLHYPSSKEHCQQVAEGLSNNEIKTLRDKVKKEYQQNRPKIDLKPSRPMTEIEKDMYMWLDMM
jgi:hypothetical protein